MIKRTPVGVWIGLTAGLGLIGLSAGETHKPLLVWNGSASAPLGLYRHMFGPVKRGDWVLSKLPTEANTLVISRHYLPVNVPVIKRIGALAGDVVCRVGQIVFVNGLAVAVALDHDKSGRQLPRWQGCLMLKSGEVLLLLPHSKSFDGRYFGITNQALIIEKLTPVWTYGGRDHDQ